MPTFTSWKIRIATEPEIMNTKQNVEMIATITFYNTINIIIKVMQMPISVQENAE